MRTRLVWPAEQKAFMLSRFRSSAAKRQKTEPENKGERDETTCSNLQRFLDDKFKEEKKDTRCVGDFLQTNALKEEVKRDWTLKWAIQYFTGDESYHRFMDYVRSQKVLPSTNIPPAAWEDTRTDDDVHTLVYARILKALDTAPISDDERFLLFRGSIGDYNNALFSATTRVRHALEYATRPRLQENSVLQVYEVDPRRGHKFLHVDAVSEYGSSECEVIVHGQFRKSCEFVWQIPTPPHYSVRVSLYVGANLTSH